MSDTRAGTLPTAWSAEQLEAWWGDDALGTFPLRSVRIGARCVGARPRRRALGPARPPPRRSADPGVLSFLPAVCAAVFLGFGSVLQHRVAVTVPTSVGTVRLFA